MIEIIPAGTSAVVTEGNKHPDRWDLSAQMQRDQIETNNRAERNESASVVRTSLASSQVASSELNTQKVIDESMLRSDSHYDKSQKQLSDSVTATVVGFKDAQALAYQVQGQALLEAAKNFNAISVQNTSNFNLAQVQAQMFASAAQLQAQVFASAAALQAQTLASEAAAKAAECCCEIKSLVREDGQKTRDLVNSITEQNLRDRASRAEASLAAYFAAKVAPVTP